MKKETIIKKAIQLRKKGFSFREISEKLGIAKSTTSLWLRDIKLSKSAKKRIEQLSIIGRDKAVKTNQKKRTLEDQAITDKVGKHFRSIVFSKFDSKIACALLYWCEGGRLDKSRVSFINSDPEMIEYFLKVFRKSFKIDESKFRALIHLHSYHDPKVQSRFWSRITGIPPGQFSKAFLKPNSGKSKRKNYPGCVSIRYYDSRIKKELICVYKMLMKNMRA